jgi:hypothetical protein
MKVIFYSEQCEYCKKLLEYLDKYTIRSLFKLVNIDIFEAPKDIDMVPTIIDTELNQPLKGKEAFKYLVNIKYFNNPTNNIEYVKELPPNPVIQKDEKALSEKNDNLEIINDKQNNDSVNFYDSTKDLNVSQTSNEMTKLRQQQDKKLSILLKMRKRS